MNELKTLRNYNANKDVTPMDTRADNRCIASIRIAHFRERGDQRDQFASNISGVTGLLPAVRESRDSIE